LLKYFPGCISAFQSCKVVLFAAKSYSDQFIACKRKVRGSILGPIKLSAKKILTATVLYPLQNVSLLFFKTHSNVLLSPQTYLFYFFMALIFGLSLRRT